MLQLCSATGLCNLILCKISNVIIKYIFISQFKMIYSQSEEKAKYLDACFKNKYITSDNNDHKEAFLFIIISHVS